MTVLVLNATYEPIHVTSIKRAVVLLLKEKAEVIELAEGVLHAETATMTCPAVIRLIAYVKIPAGHRKRITRRAVFARDGWACQYCGATSTLTIDHVVPQSKGGATSWENIVAACVPCNHRKGDSSLRDVGMKLRRKPRAPRADVFIFVHVKVAPASWQQYLTS